MKSRLHRLEIRNFKAFREFTLDLEGRHLLVYGPNGSGKSSLYWALYTFLQSARKPTTAISKYFDADHLENLLNIHEDAEELPGEVAATLRDFRSGKEITFRLGRDIHSTKDEPDILKGDLASDFITYRFFFGFSHFSNSEKFNVWPLFEREILPFCVSTSGARTPLACWNAIKTGKANPLKIRGLSGTYAYKDFERNRSVFGRILPGIVDSISREAQRFYDAHFSADDPAKVNLRLGVTTLPVYDRRKKLLTPPVIEFGIQVGGKTITRPQAYLNEAKLTQFALSVRFAASLVNLHDSDLKLLVLDDLLVSLDMSNRIKVVEILLSNTFANYQKIVLTHDLGFFREFRRKIGSGHAEWSFVTLEGDPATTIVSHSEKTEIQKAEEYLDGHNLDEAAQFLRKAAEDTANRFLNRDCNVDPTKEFVGLTGTLRAARNNIHTELPIHLYKKVLRNTPEAHRNLLVASSDDDIDSNTALDKPTKGCLKTNRERLRRLVSQDHVERLRKIILIDEILACTERVLNPAAHADNPPLYKKEVQDALDLIKQLETSLAP